MKPAFGIIRHIERRESNEQVTGRGDNRVTVTATIYAVMVVRVVFLWVTVWTHEIEYPI